MKAIENPTGIYDLPPDGTMPAKCPSCGASLEHFKQTGVRPVMCPAPVFQSMPFESQNERSTPQTPQPAKGRLAIANNIYMPELPTMVEVPVNLQTIHVKSATPAVVCPPSDSQLDAMDHPLVGGKITVFVLLYGDFIHLHRRCLTSIIRSVPADRLDLRVACNQVCVETKNFLRDLPITKVYVDSRNRRKYPAMREMFNDPTCPITTQWVVWFDDDSYVRNVTWLSALAQAIIASGSGSTVGMYGQKMYHPLKATGIRDPRSWFYNAPWWGKKDFRDKRGHDTPNGNCIHFITGGFWCLSAAAIRDCDIPCARLNHNGGDICIGEQIHQGGYQLKLFNDEKKLVYTSNHARRGYHEKFQWM